MKHGKSIKTESCKIIIGNDKSIYLFIKDFIDLLITPIENSHEVDIKSSAKLRQKNKLRLKIYEYESLTIKVYEQDHSSAVSINMFINMDNQLFINKDIVVYMDDELIKKF